MLQHAVRVVSTLRLQREAACQTCAAVEDSALSGQLNPNYQDWSLIGFVPQGWDKTSHSQGARLCVPAFLSEVTWANCRSWTGAFDAFFDSFQVENRDTNSGTRSQKQVEAAAIITTYSHIFQERGGPHGPAQQPEGRLKQVRLLVETPTPWRWWRDRQRE